MIQRNGLFNVGVTVRKQLRVWSKVPDIVFLREDVEEM